MSVNESARAWFSLRGSVSRRFYVLSGMVLMALKYAGDTLLVWAVTRGVISPADYLHPVFSVRVRALGPTPDWLFMAMAC